MASSTSTVLAMLAICASLTTPARANNFVHGAPGASSGERISSDRLRKSLLEEIEGSLGKGSAARRVARLEKALGPMFAALPKNEYGNLGHTTVRYALHRLFVQRNAWYVKGLQPDGNARNASSAADMLNGAVPSSLQEFFERRLGNKGFTMHETAVFAATIEHLVHDETADRLELAYRMKGFQKESNLTEHQVDLVVDNYMKIYILGREDASIVGDEDLPAVYPSWGETQQFLRETRQNILFSEEAHIKPMGKQMHDFNVVSHIVEDVGEHFGLFQNTECRQLKTDLIHHGDVATGRVQLAKFYEAALDHGQWQFQETAGYLRQIGALDESDPKSPSVIIANYVDSPGNCLASSSFYSVCCINECEALLGELEREFAAPEGEPKHLAKLVASLSTATVQAPRELPAALITRLDEVAAEHGGTVPLHGRLFAQWLHQAFPLECPYPHLAGSTNPQTADEWMQGTGADTSVASEEEMRRIIEEARAYEEANKNVATSENVQQEKEALPWVLEEELLVTGARQRPRGGMRGLILLVILAAGAFSMRHTILDAMDIQDKVNGRRPPAKMLEKYLV